MIFLGIIFAYLLGSIPTAVWYGSIFHGIDIREHGSGNAGATNSLRTLGKKAGIIVLIIDFLKGFLAVYIISRYFSSSLSYVPYLVGIAVILGHIFPIFAQFRGGKGIATAMGVLVATFPWIALGCLIVFLIIAFATKYISLASIIATLSFPIQLMLDVWHYQPDKYAIIFAWTLFIIVATTHRQNIKRLINRTESKFRVKK